MGLTYLANEVFKPVTYGIGSGQEVHYERSE